MFEMYTDQKFSTILIIRSLFKQVFEGRSVGDN